MRDLSIIIPARNEMWLSRTVEDILSHIEADTEIIIVLDGAPADPPVPVHERVKVIELTESIGQRAATNMAVRESTAKYIMKIDAHCAVDQGFDRKMIEGMQDNWTMVPAMRNMHVFNWVCTNGHSRYQGPSGVCTECGEPTERDVVWIPKTNPLSTSYCFDPTPHFQYNNEYKSNPEWNQEYSPTMSLQGSCFMLTREKYWELNICDESFGSWGSQGIEVAVKTWLSGGEVRVNKNTWYAHLFRTQGGDFGFPYQLSGTQVAKAKKTARDLFFEGKWEKQIHPLSWLVERFWPVKGWTDADLSALKAMEGVNRGAIYYSDGGAPKGIQDTVQAHIKYAIDDIASCTLVPMDMGRNTVLDMERGYITMHRQMLTALEASTADIVYFTEHDVVYHSSHFSFVPPKRDVFYYNTNIWQLRLEDGFMFRTDDCRKLSQLVCYRDFAVEHFKKRLAYLGAGGDMRRLGFEPGTQRRVPELNAISDRFESEYPNIDVRHTKNLTPSRWRKDQFRNKIYTRGWQEAYEVEGWDMEDLLGKLRE